MITRPVSPLLEVRDLRVYFRGPGPPVRAVDGISFSIGVGESLGIVGESGCGKSMTALSIMRVLHSTSATVESGVVSFLGRDLLSLPEAAMERIRGNEISMVFQEPMSSLNPVFSIGDQIAETVVRHKGVSRREGLDRAIESLRLVGMGSPERRVRQYPHELSGGMRQRVMIAMALSCSPKLLIADEPTTALDVTIQAQILDLIARIREETGTALLLITHDLGVIAEVTTRVLVMYAGRIVEQGSVEKVLEGPEHPYTEGLVRSVPGPDAKGRRLHVIPGSVPHLDALPPGCNFAPRCPFVFDKCRTDDPILGRGELLDVACWLYPKDATSSDKPVLDVANHRRPR